MTPILLAVEEEAAHNPLIPPLGEVIMGVLAFSILFFVLSRAVFPQAEALFQRRRDEIEGKLETAERERQEAQALLAQYRAQLETARDEAARLRDEARAQGETIRQELRAQAEEEQRRILAAGETQLAAERQQTLASLRREVGEIALSLASRVVGESLEDDARSRRTVDRFLEQMDSLDATPGRPAGSEPAGQGV